MRGKRILTIGLTILCLAASGCNRSPDSASRSGSTKYATDGKFTMAVSADPGSFDPYHSQLIFGQAHLAYDSLVNLRRDGKFVSGLAEDWRADAHSATFALRSGVTCSDGTPLTAAQVAADINYVADPANGSAQYGVNTPPVPLTATASDASRTVKVVTKKPFGFLLHTIGQLPIMCSRGLKDSKILKTASDGTGPFVLTQVIPGQSYTFKVRKDYAWGPDGATTKEPGTPSTLVLRVVENDTTATNLMLSGEVNLAQIMGEDRKRLEAAGLGRVDRPLAGAWLWFNQLNKRPTADQRVRRALVQALNLDQLIKVNTGGTGKAAASLSSMEPKPCAGDTVAGRFPPHDVKAAKALLDEAGWIENANGTRSKDGARLRLDLHYVPSYSPFNKPTAELVALSGRPSVSMCLSHRTRQRTWPKPCSSPVTMTSTCKDPASTSPAR
jgi:peptide/nickel transport system substrate-binding protein